MALAWVVAVGVISGCKRPEGAANGSRARADGGAAILVPQALAPVGARSPSGREIDAPLAWMFVPQWPATTGSSPDVIAAAHLPCGFRMMYSTVDRDGAELRVRVRARFAGPNPPTDRTTPCPTEPPALQFVSLNTVRLGDYQLVDAALHPAGAIAAPAPLALPVVRDDNTTPSEADRWVRQCTPGDDSFCVAHGGGVCATARERADKGVCVPPLDPYLVVGRPCPERTAEIELDHRGAFATPVAPRGSSIRACLPACSAEGRCPTGLECVRRVGSSGPGACLR
ncbi:MAG: hypothetical protein JNK05_17115 [Myxococcales bacterium]|nr:hypothetical protein [Myxococcales bacterium]